MRTILVGLVLFNAVNASAQAGPHSLRDLCAAQGSKGVHISIVSDSPPPPPFENIIRATDMIVRATVGPSSARLTPDDRNIVTTFELLNPLVLFAAKAQSVERPSVPSKMMFTLQGGTVVLNDCKATVAYGGMPDVRTGADVIFLMRETPDGTFAPIHMGMFEVARSGIHAMLGESGEHQKFEGRPVAEVVADILAARKAVKK